MGNNPIGKEQNTFFGPKMSFRIAILLLSFQGLV